jgi:lipopolysaccharide export LptBFGC system permease protein LptF
MNLGDLRAMGRDPELYPPIGKRAQKARRIAIANELVKRLHAQLDSQGYFELYGQRRYRFKGRIAEPAFAEEGAQNFLTDATVEEYDPAGELISRTFREVDQLDLLLVESGAGESGENVTATIVMHDALVSGSESGFGEEVLEQSKSSIGGLGIPPDILDQGQNLSLETIREADFTEPFPEQLGNISWGIGRLQGRLSKKIALEIHSRLAMAVSCPILAVLGALLGAIFRKGQFLVAVGLCIGPAVVAMLFIIMGQKMVDSPAFSVGMAVSVAWTGLILLVIANLVLGIKVLRR